MRITPGLAASRLRTLEGWNSQPNLRRAVRLAEHMIDSGDVTVAQALDVLLPGGSSAAKMETLQQVVADVRAAAVDVILEVEAARANSTTSRLLFHAAQVVESAPQLTELGTVGSKLIEHQSATVQRAGKPLVRLFLSYSTKDKQRAAELWSRLHDYTKIDNRYRFELWDFKQSLLPGDDWHARTQEAITQGDLGIFAVSRHFLGSNYIHNYELPNFIDRNAAVPILLESINLRQVDCKGLEGRQIFRHNDRAYDNLRGDGQRNIWVQALRDKIHEVLDQRSTPKAATFKVRQATTTKEKFAARAKLDDLEKLPYYAPLLGERGKLPGSPEQPVSQSSGSHVDAVTYLVEWASVHRSPLAAVLGEYGMGKTITCQAVMREIHRQRESGNDTLPEPLYFDLRNISHLRQREQVPTLMQILQECIDRGWTTGDSGRPRADDILTRAAEHPTLFVIDGLDEALVHLNAGDGAILTRELLSLRPPKDGRTPVAGIHTKLLLSCRTHYFRSVSEQYGHFTGQHRDTAEGDDFEALLLLPLAEDQIRLYLASAVPDRDASQVFDMLSDLHDLSDLTSRPVTLKLITQQISFIEKRRAQGHPVYAADIYQRIVIDWLERDKGKEQFRSSDKLILTSRLAAWMWKRKRNAVDLDDVENWLHEQLEDDPAMSRRYGKVDPVLLEEDLRTATFLVRQDTADGTSTQGFRFAHTSFQEFFLARYLLDSIDCDQPNDWHLHPSDETLEFLGQLLQGHSERERLLSVLSEWRYDYREGVSELLLRYALRALRRGHPSPQLSGIDLSGANLRGWTLDGTEQRLFSLSGARLVGADLQDTEWNFVDLSGADLTRAQADRAAMHQSRLNHARMVETSLTGTIFHFCSLDGTTIENVDINGTTHIGGSSALPNPPAAARTTLVPLGGHTSQIFGLEWSSDGARLLTGSGDQTARIWDTLTGQTLHILTGHNSPVWNVTWSPDSTRAITCSSNEVQIWDAETGRLLNRIIPPEGTFEAIDFTSDRSRLATGGTENVARIWDIATGQLLKVLAGHTGPVSDVTFSPDDSRIVTGSHDTTARIWDIATEQSLHVLAGPASPVEEVGWSPDGSRLLTGYDDDTARIWDTSGHCLYTLTAYTPTRGEVVWSPDSTRLLTSGQDNAAHLWDTNTGELVHTFTGHTAPVWALGFTADGTHLFTAGEDSDARIWNTETGKSIGRYTGRGRRLEAVAFTPDGNHLLTSTDTIAVITNVFTGRAAPSIEDHTMSWWRAAWSPSGTQILAGGIDRITYLLDAATGQILRTFTGHTGPVWTVCWSPDGSHFLSGSDDHAICLWDVITGQTIRVFTGHTRGLEGIAWSPDGSRIVSCADDATRLWDVDSGNNIDILTGHSSTVESVTFSPDGTRLLTGSSDNTARIWDAESGQTLRILKGHTGPVWTVRWSTDGTRLFTGGADKTVRMWDSRTGRLLRIFVGHTESVWTADISVDGTRLITGSDDNTARIWDIETGEIIRTLTQHTAPIWAVEFSSDGTRALTTSSDGSLRIWDSSGAQVMSIHTFDRQQCAAWSPVENRLLSSTPEAWRFIRAACFDKDDRLLGLQPHERYYTQAFPYQ
ncbi:eIF2A-related protein [Nocardia takedensis]